MRTMQEVEALGAGVHQGIARELSNSNALRAMQAYAGATYELFKSGEYAADYDLLDPESIGKAVVAENDQLAKAMLTGTDASGNAVNIIQDKTTGAAALRVQFLHDRLEKVSFEQDDAVMMKTIPKEKVYSITFEWTVFNQYGGAGDGFVGETGTDGAFGVAATDDNFTRLLKTVKYMAAVRQVSLVAQLVRNVEDAMKTAETGATLEIVGKANLAIYFGDSKKAEQQFDGLIRQLLDWLTPSTGYGQTHDQSIIYDAGGNPISKEMLEDIAVLNRQKFGKGTLLMTSPVAYGDAQKLLFPEARTGEGETGTFGTDKRNFKSPYGTIKLVDDPMLRLNQPLVVEGSGVDGKPRASADSGALSFSANPLTISAVSPSTGYFWENVSRNDHATVAALTVPALPSGEGNQANRLAADTYWYAVSVVYQGKESLPWYTGNNAATINTLPTATGQAVTAGQVVKLAIDLTNLTGATVTAALRKSLKFRFYRFDGTTAPTSRLQYKFIGECGVAAAASSSVDAVLYDNGFTIPGSDNAFLITESKNGAKGWFLAQLLPLMRRKGLASYVMGDPLAMLAFLMPILVVPRHHVWIRNIGRA